MVDTLQMLHRTATEQLPFRTMMRGGGSRGRVLLALKVSITLGALLLLVQLVDGHVLLARLRTMPGAVLAGATALMAAQIGLVAVRWRTVMAALPRLSGRLPDVGRAVEINFAAVLLAQLMPSVAGDGLRVILARDAGAALGTAIEATVLDRVVALLALLVMALPAVALSPLVGTAGVRVPVAVVLVAALLTAAGAIVAAGPLSRARWRLVGMVGDVLRHLRGLISDKRRGPAAFGLSAVGHGVGILVFWMLARGQGLPLDLADACAVVPMVLLIQIVPVAIGGWGLREGLVVTLLGARGIGPEDALLLSLCFGALQIVAALPGFGALLRTTWASRRRPARA